MTTQPASGQPVLFEVSSFAVGAVPQTKELVAQDLTDDLAWFFLNPGLTDQRTRRAEGMVTKLAMAKGLWLMCGCLGSDNPSAPLLYGQRVPRGLTRKAVLVPFYARGDHDEKCPFVRSAPDTSGAPSLLARTKRGGGFAVLNSLGDSVGSERERGLREPVEQETAK